MDVPSTAKGVVEKVHVAKGGTVSTGALIVSVKRRSCRRACRLPRRGRHTRQAAPRRPPRPRASARGCAGQARAGQRLRAAALPPDRRSQLRGGARLPVGAQIRARTRRQSRERARQRREGPHPARRRQGVRQAGDVAAVWPARAGAGAAESAQLRPGRVRRGRSQAAQSRAEDLRPAPAGRMGQHPARHAIRRIGHHRTRSSCAARSRKRPPRRESR